MDKGSQTELTLMRMPEGGFAVVRTANDDGRFMPRFLFASTEIDVALGFMRDLLKPITSSAEKTA